MSDQENKEQPQQRKASEILLELEEKINLLMKMMSVYDMNAKLILDRVNKIYSTLNVSNTSQPSNNQVVQTYKDFATSKLAEPVSQQKSDGGNSPIFIQGNSAIPQAEEPISDKRGTRVSLPAETEPVHNGNFRKYPVQQHVVDTTGKKMFMAEVTFTNEDTGKTAFKGKTNTDGKYTAGVPAGNYSIHIIKTDTSSQKKYEVTQKVSIKPKETVEILPPVIVR